VAVSDTHVYAADDLSRRAVEVGLARIAGAATRCVLNDPACARMLIIAVAPD
jgi:hypothetical protein